MLVLLLFFLVCVWKALNNHTCPRARKMSAGNPMPATFRQPHAGNPKQLATLCHGTVKHCTFQALRKKNKQQAPPATTGAVKRLPLPRCQEEDAFATAVATAATTASRGTSCR